jgi:hypothetical protein
MIAREGEVLAVLAEVADRGDSLAVTLKDSLGRADSVREGITLAVEKLHAAKQRYKDVRSDLSRANDERDGSVSRAAEAADTVERADRRLKEIREMQAFGVEDEALFAEMGRALTAQKDKTLERDRFRQRADDADLRAKACEAMLGNVALEIEARGSELKELQKGLPDPHTFALLGLAHFGRANAHFLLNGDASIFDRNFRIGAGVIKQLHQEMREGRYRLDRFGDLLAGRHEASVQALYGAAAIGDLALATDLFSLAADPGMYFHQIFNVFRTWLIGAYLLGDKRVLGQLLRLHRFDKNIWRGYCRAFRGLVEQRAKDVNDGIGIVLSLEQRPADLAHMPGLGLIHLPALGIARLARLRNLAVTVKDERLPNALLDW